MNFLELCKETARISGVIAGLPSFTTVEGSLNGRIDQLVGFVNSAWVDLQNERPDWLWMRKTFDEALIANQISYTAANLSLTRVGKWLPDRPGHCTFTLYDPATGKADEGTLNQIGYDRWRQMYDRGVHDANRPAYWAAAPDGTLKIGPKPDKIYNLTGEYRAAPQELASNADTPEMPEQFHRVIISEAIRLMARSDEAYQALLAENTQYERLRNALVREQVPDPDMTGTPLA